MIRVSHTQSAFLNDVLYFVISQAVIPLSEHGGLIEWANNTQPFRSILTKLHIEAGRPINWANMSRLAPLQEDPLE